MDSTRMRLRRVLVILFMRKLERVLREEEFDSFVESKCSPYYAKKPRSAEHTAGCVFSNAVDRLL